MQSLAVFAGVATGEGPDLRTGEYAHRGKGGGRPTLFLSDRRHDRARQSHGNNCNIKG